MFDFHFCQRHSSTSVHLHRKRTVAGAARELVSRGRGGDVTQEEPGSSADERVLAPRSALRDLKRAKLHSILAFEACPQLPRVPTCVIGGVRAGLMLVSPRVLLSLPDRCCVGARRPERGHVQWERPKCGSEVSRAKLILVCADKPSVRNEKVIIKKEKNRLDAYPGQEEQVDLRTAPFLKVCMRH